MQWIDGIKVYVIVPALCSLTHVRLVSLIKENKRSRHLPRQRIKFASEQAYGRARLPLRGKWSRLIPPFYNLSLGAQNVAWPGAGLILGMILNPAEQRPCWQDPGRVVTSKRAAKLLIISLTVLLPVNRAGCRLQHGSTLLLKHHCIIPLGNPLSLWAASKPWKKTKSSSNRGAFSSLHAW